MIEQDLADGGGIIGRQFLYFFHDSPCLAAGFDISHAGFDDHNSSQLLMNRFTSSSADNTTGVAITPAQLSERTFPSLHTGRLRRPSYEPHFKWYSHQWQYVERYWNHRTATASERWSHGRSAIEGAIGMHIYFTERFFIGAELKILDLEGKDFTPTAAGTNEGLAECNRPRFRNRHRTHARFRILAA